MALVDILIVHRALQFQSGCVCNGCCWIFAFRLYGNLFSKKL